MMKKKLISCIMVVLMLASLFQGAVMAEDIQSYGISFLGSYYATKGEVFRIDDVGSSAEQDENIQRAMLYNSNWYDSAGIERDKAVIVFKDRKTKEEYSFEQEKYPLICVKTDEYDGKVYERGLYNLEFVVPDSLEADKTYSVSVILDIPEGKEVDPRIRPLTITINNFKVEGNGAGDVQPEETQFVAELPNQSAFAGDKLILKEFETLVPDRMQFGLVYASTAYEKYINKDASVTFANDKEHCTVVLDEVPLKYLSYGKFELEINVPADLDAGVYEVTIELDIAKEKDADDVKPYKFIIEKFEVQAVEDNEEKEDNTVFNIADTTTLQPISGAEIFVSNEEGTVNAKVVSNDFGVAKLYLEDGMYSVQVISSGYEVRNFVIERTDEQCEFSPYLNKNPLINVQSSVKEMTREEMVEAGINVNAIENKHIYKCVTVLKFEPVAESGDVTILPIELKFDYVYDETGSIIQAKPAYYDGKVVYPVAKDIYLIIHSEVTWLKEMFDVQLVVANTSAIEKITECAANLNLPAGLSLAVMNAEQQSLSVALEEIAPNGTADVHWYICGDEEGEYIIDGTVDGKRVGGGITEPVKASFTMQEPITVLAGNSMKLLIEAERYAVAGMPYKVAYTLENVSGKTLYDVVLNVLGGKFCKSYSIEELIHDGELVDLENLTGQFNKGVDLEAEKFEPGDILSGVFEITFGAGIDVEEDIKYMVTQMFAFTAEGSTTTIPTEIVLVDSVDYHNFDEGTVEVEATCATEGKKVYRCTDDGCEETKEVIIKKADHVLGDWVVKVEATCKVAGEKVRECSNCDYEVKTEYIDSEHSWNEGEITTQPTTSSTGVKTYTCEECNENKYETVKKLSSGGRGGNTGVKKENTNNKEVTEEKTEEKEEQTEEPAEEKTEAVQAFDDVKTDSWYFDAIKYVSEKGLMKGMSDKEFAPDAKLTRAMFVTILYRLENEPEADKNIFADVEAGSWYENAVAWANNNEIIKGISDKEFAPESDITREQMAVVLYRYAKYKGFNVEVEESVKYNDSENVANYASGAIDWANSKSLMNGYDNGAFGPKDSSTRAQVATVIMRFIENLK